VLRVRAETTKNRLERVVPYSASTGVLLSEYLAHRAGVSRGARAAVLVGVAAQSRPAAEPVELVEGGPPGRVGRRCRAVLHAHDPAPVPDGPGPDGLGGARDCRLRRAPPHDSTLRYIHLSGRELADKLNRGMEHIHAWRVRALTGNGRPETAR
jgi:integrase/recombinase XerD